MPALNEREEDIPLIANHFIEEISQNMGKPLMKFDLLALEELKKSTGQVMCVN